MIDQNSESQTGQNVRRLAAEIVAAYVGANTVAAGQLPELIRSVVTTLSGLEGGVEEPVIEPPKPPVSIRRSVTPDYLICLEDGKKLKMLKRHLRTTYNMSPKDYREKWGIAGLSPDGRAELRGEAIGVCQEDRPWPKGRRARRRPAKRTRAVWGARA